MIVISSQLYDAQELKKYNLCLNDHRKTTTSTLNAVAVPLLNKVCQPSPQNHKNSVVDKQHFWYILNSHLCFCLLATGVKLEGGGL